MPDQLSPVRHRRHEDVLVLRHHAEVGVGLLEDDIQAEVFHRRLQVDVRAELEPRNPDIDDLILANKFRSLNIGDFANMARTTYCSN